MTPTIYIIGTCDTKGEELAFAADCARKAGASAKLIDVSTTQHTFPSDHKIIIEPQTDRGLAVTAMANTLTQWLTQQTDIGAVLGLGGSGNTSIVTQAMRALPVGIPKLMVSTLASGNVADFVGPTDIMMMHSVVDIAGLNAVSRQVIGNAAHAAAGMALNTIPKTTTTKKPVGFTMFGVTTTCISNIRKHLEPDIEPFVFHATGTGGKSFEKLAESKFFEAVFDITTTEVADHLCGGMLPCTEDRFGAFIRNPITYVGSVGAVDMVNFGARDTVPTKYAHRKFHIHNAHVTLMRTTPDENIRVGQFIVDRLNQMQGPVRFLLPLKGVSAIDAEGQPFYDLEADAALFSTIRKNWISAPNRKLLEIDAHINDAAFAAAAVAAYKEIA